MKTCDRIKIKVDEQESSFSPQVIDETESVELQFETNETSVSPTVEDDETNFPIQLIDATETFPILVDEIGGGSGAAQWGRIYGDITTQEDLMAILGPGGAYIAGNGIVIVNRTISLDDLILDCGTSTTVL